MIKHKKIIIFLLLAYALFIVGVFNVKADGFTLAYDNGSYFCNSDSCSSVNLGYYTKNGTIYYEYQGTNNGSERYNYLELRTVKSVDITNYDYILMQVSSYSWMTMSSVIVSTTNGILYGYPISTTASDNSNIKTSIYKIDCSSSNTFNGNMRFYFDITETNRFYMYLPIVLYLGKTGDSTSQIIANNTNNINNSINDSSIDTNNTDSSVGGFSSSTNSSMSNTPVSSMISLPITFLTGVNNALSNSCTNVNYIELFGYQLVLPCLNLSERLGSVWIIIDTIFSCMLIFSIGKSLVSTFARLSDMDTNIMYECYANGTKHRGESFDD